MPTVRVDHWTKLGATIREARLRHEWSQHELANRAHVSRSWLARVEAGHRGAELEPLLRLLAALGITLQLTTPAATPETTELAPKSQNAQARERAWGLR